jgi:hypothetical protein
MTGVFAGFDKDIRMRDTAWGWMMFYGGNEAQLIQAKVFVENGLGRFVQPKLLEKAGYSEFINKIPSGWAETSREALKTGVPEPYGSNCQLVYLYMNKAIDQIRTDEEVRRCILERDEPGTKKRIQEILNVRVELANQKMMNILPENVRNYRARVAAAVFHTHRLCSGHNEGVQDFFEEHGAQRCGSCARGLAVRPQQAGIPDPHSRPSQHCGLELLAACTRYSHGLPGLQCPRFQHLGRL